MARFWNENCIIFVRFMKRKKYFSLILLCLFLFPFIEIGLHDFSHRKDLACSIKTEKHLHREEHHCFICDFNFPFAGKSTENNCDIVLTVLSYNYFSIHESIILPCAENTLPSRAPPIA